ncbi:hypothetical protein BDR07DRAFT_1479840 [Suillus spraguei]|nr:hypothetical protein BDR07DRAFT_1479840 [Suillus spraguei]
MPGLISLSNIPPQEHASCVEAAAAELKFVCIFDDLIKDGSRNSFPKFTAKEYGPTYRSALKSLHDIMRDPYHGPKLVKQL